MSYSTMAYLHNLNGTIEEMHMSQNRTNNRTNSSDSTSNTTLVHPECLVLRFHDFIPWDNPDNIISFQAEDIIRRLKDVVFLPVLFLIGGSANVINMAVFYKQGLSVRINVCLFALSLADELFLSSSMMLFGEQLYIQFTTKQT